MNKNKLRIKAFINKCKERIEFFFNQRGYTFKLEKKEAINLTVEQIKENPFYIQQAFQKQAEIFIELSVDKARTLSGENFFDIKKHHSVLALEDVLKENDNVNIEKALFQYYKKNTIPIHKKIKSLSEIFGITLKKLKNIPPWLVIYPWHKVNIDDLAALIKRVDLSTYVENKKRGMGVNASEGGSQYVFTSEKRAELEAKLIANLYKSISKKGFDEKENLKDPIGAVLFINDEKYAWMVSGGIHRVCVLHALKQKHINVKLKGIIYKRDLEYYPNVENNLFSKNEAERLFDKIISN